MAPLLPGTEKILERTQGEWESIKSQEGVFYIDKKETPMVLRLGDIAVCSGENPEADSAFIVRAVNCHQDLLEALKEAYSAMEHHGIPLGDPAFGLAQHAIAKAEGRAQ